MSTLLKIQSSLNGSAGQSSQLADRFAQQWLASHPGGRIVMRDLAQDSIPHLTAERFQSFFVAPESRTPEQRTVAAYSDELVAEIKAADVIVLAVPMYNFSVPSTLRAYFDHIARVGVTFQYTSEGPRGLLEGKKAYVFITRGGFYPEVADTQTPYLRQFLGFIGIKDVEFIHAEGLARGEDPREKSLAAARHTIAKLLPVAA